jgi:hypothetical protein
MFRNTNPFFWLYGVHILSLFRDSISIGAFHRSCEYLFGHVGITKSYGQARRSEERERLPGLFAIKEENPNLSFMLS